MRKQLLIGSVFAVAAIASLFLWHYLRMGRLEVETNSSNNTISVMSTKDQEDIKNVAPIKHGVGKLDANLPSGVYVVVAQNSSGSIRQTITVTARHTRHLKLNPTEALITEPVATLNAHNITVDGSSLQYLDKDSNKISQINESGIVSTVGPETFQTIKSAGNDYSIGLANNGRLYEVRAGELHLIDLPISYRASDIKDFDIAANGRMYVAVNASIYSGYMGSPLSKIYQTNLSAPRISATQQALAIISPPSSGDKSSQKAEVEIIGSGGDLIRRVSVSANSAAWSTDGKNLALINYTGRSAVYMLAQNKLLALPNGSILQAHWYSDDRLLYSTAGTLWSYSLHSNQASSLAKTNSGSTINEVTADVTGKFAYMVVETPAGTAIQRAGLKGQQTSSDIYKLAVFLPDDIDQCHVGYVNLVSPTILLYPFSPTLISGCEQAVQNQLQDDQLDISRFRFVVVQVLSQSD